MHRFMVGIACETIVTVALSGCSNNKIQAPVHPIRHQLRDRPRSLSITKIKPALARSCAM